MPAYELFGGAITVDLPKSCLVDASELRQVPDTQEVLLSPDSDLSLIFEVLEFVEEGRAGEDDEAAIRFHFGSLAHDNSALSSSITSTSLPPAPTVPSPSHSTPPPIKLHGTQRVAKFNLPASEADDVRIWMALWRLRGVGNGGRGTDLVLTVNLPMPRHSTASGTTNGMLTNGETTMNGVGGEDGGTAEAEELFEAATRSFRIVDFGLFA